jgi:hypothetical protein
MSRYKYTRWDADEIKKVPIERVLMSKPIHQAVKAQGGSISGKGFKGDPRAAPFPLSRMDGMMAAMEEGVRLPVMKVKPVQSGGHTYYSVEDGRHRFAASIVAGMTHVPVQFS